MNLSSVALEEGGFGILHQASTDVAVRFGSPQLARSMNECSKRPGQLMQLAGPIRWC